MRDYVQIGVIEVNRMGSLRYFMWLGISAAATDEQSDTHAEGFNSIELVLGEHSFRLDILGWREEVIGVSETVYKKLFSTSVDAYYEVTLQQIEQVSNAERVKLRTTGETPEEFVSWYKQTTAKEDLAAFLDEVLR